MTLLASWAGVDSRDISSVYIMSDSRISWGDSGHFDFGRKVFGCNKHPDIFGYCGDVLFPLMVLSQIVDLIDQGLLFEFGWSCEQKSQAIIKKLGESFNNYPSHVAGISVGTVQIIHCTRDDEKNFYSNTIVWDKLTNKWSKKENPFFKHSDKLIVLGSGKTEFDTKYIEYMNSDNARTSRALFHCFCDSLFNIASKYCGGAPQLVGLYRIDNARHFGIIYNNKRYFHGVQVDNLHNFNSIEWRNELFEICDGESMKIKNNAQRQPNPLSI